MSKLKKIEPLSPERLKEEVMCVINLLIKNAELAAILAEREQAPDFTAKEGMMICVAGMATEDAIANQMSYIKACGTSFEDFQAMFLLIREEVAFEVTSPSKLAN